MSARRGTNKLLTVYESDVVAVGETIELDGLDMGRPHCFVGAQFFSDAAGTTPAVPTAGTVTISVKTFNTQVYEPVADPVITASAPTTRSWSGNSIAVKAVPADIDVATHYKIVATCNES